MWTSPKHHHHHWLPPLHCPILPKWASADHLPKTGPPALPRLLQSSRVEGPPVTEGPFLRSKKPVQAP